VRGSQREAIFGALYRIAPARGALLASQPQRVRQSHDASARNLSRHRRRRSGLSGSRAIHGIRLARNARSDHRLHASALRAEAGRRFPDHPARQSDCGTKRRVGAESKGLLQLSEALDELAVHDARLAEVVDLKYFCGFSLTDIAAMRGVALRTVQRD
jgi:DNA-directed RNA polymerase specialized sigma24 family protein